MADCRGLSDADADAAFRQYERDLRTAQAKTRAARQLETFENATKAAE